MISHSVLQTLAIYRDVTQYHRLMIFLGFSDCCIYILFLQLEQVNLEIPHFTIRSNLNEKEEEDIKKQKKILLRGILLS